MHKAALHGAVEAWNNALDEYKLTTSMAFNFSWILMCFTSFLNNVLVFFSRCFLCGQLFNPLD